MAQRVPPAPRPADLIYPLSGAGIDGTGVTPVGAQISALCVQLLAAGWNGIDGGNNTYNISDTLSIPARAVGKPFTVRGGTWDGTASSLAGTLQAVIEAEVNPLATIPYGARYWTQTIVTGDGITGRPFTGVANIVGLSVGDYVLVRLGCDPTDASGWSFESYIAKITAITPGAGTTGDITVDRPVPETVMNPLPAYNMNFLRLATKHDLIKVTGFQDNLTLDRCTFRKVHVAPQFARGLRVVQPFVPDGTICFSFYDCEAAHIIDPTVERILGVDVGGGGPYSSYGWFLSSNQSKNTVVQNLDLRNFGAQQGVFNCELQTRGTHFTGTTRVAFNVTNAPASLVPGFGQTPNSSDRIVIDHLIVEGGSNVTNSPNVRIGILDIEGTNESNSALPQSFFLNADQVGQSLKMAGVVYDGRKQLTQLIAPAASATTNYAIPVTGKIRSLKLFTSSTTGITHVNLLLDGVNPVVDLVSDLVVGGWCKPNQANLLSFQGPNYWTDSHVIQVVTDGSFVPGTYIYAEIEMWTASPAPDTGVYTNTSPPLQIASSGAPSVNAAFKGQTCFDRTGNVMYVAKAVGTGASDWVVL